MRRFLLFLCLSLAVGLLLSGCGGGGPSGSSLTPLTPEQIAQIEAASQRINNVLLQADDPTSPEALEAAKQVALSQPAVEQAVVAEDSLVVKYKDGGFEVWQGDIPKPTPPADIAELQALTRRVLAEARATRAPVGTRQAVLINSVYDDPGISTEKVKETFDTIKRILEAKGFHVNPLNGAQASTANLKELSGCSVFVMLSHGGRDLTFGNFTIPYSVQTGESWDRVRWFEDDWLEARVVKVNVPWGNEETREKNLKTFAGVTGRFWSHYYERNHFNNGLFFNLACKGSKWEAFRNELFKVGIKGYTGWSDIQSAEPYTAWRILTIMAGEKTLQQAYDELPYEYKHQNAWGEADFQIFGKDDGLNLTLGGPVLDEPPPAPFRQRRDR